MAGEQTKVYMTDGGDSQKVASGGAVDVESGGAVNVESGGDINIEAGGAVNLNDVAGLVLSDAALSAEGTAAFTMPSMPATVTVGHTKHWIKLTLGASTYYVPAVKS